MLIFKFTLDVIFVFVTLLSVFQEPVQSYAVLTLPARAYAIMCAVSMMILYMIFTFVKSTLVTGMHCSGRLQCSYQSLDGRLVWSVTSYFPY
jgi:hypothetical protein